MMVMMMIVDDDDDDGDGVWKDYLWILFGLDVDVEFHILHFYISHPVNWPGVRFKFRPAMNYNNVLSADLETMVYNLLNLQTHL